LDDVYEPLEKVPPPTFDAWKLQLRKDCELQDKLVAFDALGDYVLRLLWESGVTPSVDGILEFSPPDQKTKPN
jgi:hypothetical protein